jgi:hypothetical protein
MAHVSVDTRSQWFGDGSSQAAPVRKWVLHTTEGAGWPGYEGGAIAPNETIMPVPGVGVEVRRHLPQERSARALRNADGGVETNRQGVTQTELVGTCDPAMRGRGMYFWPAADDVVLEALAEYKRPILARLGIPLTAARFLPYPRSGWSADTERMSGPEWVRFAGICGHQHVPENTHGDPGAFPAARLVELLRQGDDVTPEDVDKIALRVAGLLLDERHVPYGTVGGKQQWLTVRAALGRSAYYSARAKIISEAVLDAVRHQPGVDGEALAAQVAAAVVAVDACDVVERPAEGVVG